MSSTSASDPKVELEDVLPQLVDEALPRLPVNERQRVIEELHGIIRGWVRSDDSDRDAYLRRAINKALSRLGKRNYFSVSLGGYTGGRTREQLSEGTGHFLSRVQKRLEKERTSAPVIEFRSRIRTLQLEIGQVKFTARTILETYGLSDQAVRRVVKASQRKAGFKPAEVKCEHVSPELMFELNE